MITGNFYKYQKYNLLFFTFIFLSGALISIPASGSDSEPTEEASTQSAAELLAEYEAVQAQLVASRKEAAKYREIARKNRETALKLKEVALQWQENARQWQNATQLAQAEAQEMRNKFREVNAKLHAVRGQGEYGLENSSSATGGRPRDGVRREGEAYSYTEIGEMTGDIAHIREQRRADVGFAEQLLQDTFGSRKPDEEQAKTGR